jgi:hypothetical protein
MSELVLKPSEPSKALASLGELEREMISYMLVNPGCRLKDISAYIGKPVGWIAVVQASEEWKIAFRGRRSEVTDRVVEQSVRERLEGITVMGLERLKEKLEAEEVEDRTVLRAVEIGIKGMGIGEEVRDSGVDHLAKLANRLVELQGKAQGRLIEGVVDEK